MPLDRSVKRHNFLKINSVPSDDRGAELIPGMNKKKPPERILFRMSILLNGRFLKTFQIQIISILQSRFLPNLCHTHCTSGRRRVLNFVDNLPDFP